MDKFLVGTMVRNLRECMGLTQKELGERIKVSRITINNWEHTGTELENYLKLVEVLFPGKPKVQAKPKVTKLVPVQKTKRERFRDLRIKHQMTQAEFGLLVGYSGPHICRLEKGQAKVTQFLLAHAQWAVKKSRAKRA